jgi:hypothetical protein
MVLPNFIPDSNQLAAIFSQAVAPAFLLGAVAAFVSLLMSRLKNIVDRISNLTRIADSDPAQAKVAQEIPYLKRRAVLLNTAAYLALSAGISTTLLLLVSFASAIFKLHHIYGGALLFAVVNGLLMVSLFKFAQEVRVELGEIRQF